MMHIAHRPKKSIERSTLTVVSQVVRASDPISVYHRTDGGAKSPFGVGASDGRRRMHKQSDQPQSYIRRRALPLAVSLHNDLHQVPGWRRIKGSARRCSSTIARSDMPSFSSPFKATVKDSRIANPIVSLSSPATY